MGTEEMRALGHMSAMESGHFRQMAHGEMGTQKKTVSLIME